MNITEIFSAGFWRQLLNGDFNRGFVAALLLILGIMILMLLIRLIFKLIFRTRRCASIVVPRPDGDIVVARAAVLEAARRELSKISGVNVTRILLFRRGEQYSMTIFCGYTPDEKTGISELCDGFKPRMQEMLARTFGIENLKQIRVVVEELEGEGPDNSAKSAPVVEPHVYSGF